jgi:leucyl aminopeptidase
MIDYSGLLFPDRGEDATSVLLLTEADFTAWLENQPPSVRAQVDAQRFSAKKGETLSLAGIPDAPAPWVAGMSADLGAWSLASLAARLPEGRYRLSQSPGDAALGWMLAQYQFDTYKAPASQGQRILLTDRPGDIDEIVRLAEATALVRDLVNTPALDMGPAEIEDAAVAVAKRHGSRAFARSTPD